MKDHVHICLSIPPKFAVSNVVGYLKGNNKFLGKGLLFLLYSKALFLNRH